MKILITKTSLLILAALIFSGCKKYEEGPSISLRSKTARVANVWAVEYAIDLEDGEVITADFFEETWGFTKDGEYVEYKNGAIDKIGSWQFVIDKEAIEITKPAGITTDVEIYTILKLKEREMWLSDGEEELHLVPAE